MEILRCRWCGAPYVYRENLELHEEGCIERPAARVPRYVLPAELQREWVRVRERKWAEGKRWHEWAAGLRVVGERVDWADFRQGYEGTVRLPDLEHIENSIGSVHHHPHPIGPSWDDIINWTWDAMKNIPGELNPIFAITFFDDVALAYVLPKPPEMEKIAWAEWGKKGKVWETFTDLKLERLGHAAQVNAWRTLWEGGRIGRRYFRLGASDQRL